MRGLGQHLRLGATFVAELVVGVLVERVVRLALLADLAGREVLAFLVMAVATLADEAARDLHSLLAVLVADSPAGQLVELLERPVIGRPGRVIAEAGDV